MSEERNGPHSGGSGHERDGDVVQERAGYEAGVSAALLVREREHVGYFECAQEAQSEPLEPVESFVHL